MSVRKSRHYQLVQDTLTGAKLRLLVEDETAKALEWTMDTPILEGDGWGVIVLTARNVAGDAVQKLMCSLVTATVQTEVAGMGAPAVTLFGVQELGGEGARYTFQVNKN